MPPTKIADSLVTISDLFEDNWVAANTMSLTPEVSTGWYEMNKPNLSQVTVTDPDEVEQEVFLHGGGAGAGTFWDGIVLVTCWTTRKVLNSSGVALDSALARKLAYLMRQEVDRIVMVNQNAVADFQHLRVVARSLVADPSEPVTTYRRVNTVGYKWIELPA